MKKSLILWVLALCLFGCGGDSASEDNGAAVVAGQESFSWGSSVTSQEIRLTASASWTAKSDANCKNWCYPVKSSDRSDKIVLWVSPNITGNARSGKVTVTVGGRSQEIQVSQPAFSGNLDTYEYHLPVVFHVMYKNESDKTQNADESQFKKILQAVNKLYADNDMDIVFEMAKYDNDGNELKEPGIVRKKVNFDDMDPSEFLDDKDFSNDVFNLKKYINIFVFSFRQMSEGETSLGLTQLPILPTAHPLGEILHCTDSANDYAYLTTPYGVCINSKFIDEWQDDKHYNTRYIVSTVAHELGHYLGLLHTFSENECEEDDECSDTPITDYNNYSAWLTDYINQKSAKGVELSIYELATRTDCKTGEVFVADNILDYAVTKAEVFTPQQKKRTRHVLKYGVMTPGPKLVNYNTTGYVTKSVSGRRAASLPPHVVSVVPCPRVPSKRFKISSN